MKRSFVAITLIALFFSIALTGCEKENVNPKSKSVSELAPELQDLYQQMPVRNFGKISVIDGNILRFETKEQYENVANYLHRDCIIWDSIFVNTYKNLNEEELYDLEEKFGYSEFIPLHIFEKTLGVSGKMLFDLQESLISNWMENGLLGEDPTDDIFNLESDQAMFNPNHEICIEDTIYQFRENALIMIPIQRLNEWRQYRNAPTDELETIFIVKKDNLDHNNLADMPPHINFQCKNYKKLYHNDFECIPTNAYSSWSVVGHRGVFYSHVLTYKLVNYKYHKTKSNGQIVYRKERRFCSMIPHVSFSIEAYEQFYQSFHYWDNEDGHLDDPLPALVNVKTFSGKTRYQYPYVNYLSEDYNFGIFTDNPTVIICIGETAIPREYNLVFQ